MLRCLIVDDSPVFLIAARGVLEGQGASVVGVALTADGAVRQVVELRPDVTLLDVNLAGESGFDLARRLSREAGVEARRIIMISTQAGDDLADLVSEARVAGFLSKSAISVDEILRLITSAG